MEVIKHGKVAAERKWSGTCHSCKAKIRAKESELKDITDSREGRHAWEKCPECGAGPYGGVCFYPEEKWGL